MPYGSSLTLSSTYYRVTESWQYNTLSLFLSGQQKEKNWEKKRREENVVNSRLALAAAADAQNISRVHCFAGILSLLDDANE